MAQYFSLNKYRDIAVCLFILLGSTLSIGQSIDPFVKSFKNPPEEYKPATWMHGMSGNMSKLGMTKD